ncbi:hypothetical protein VTN96DRAFT_5600 [Rasamsonia emersonii]
MTQEKEIYLLKRDKDESARLDEQHTFFVDVIGGSPIHASISKDRLFAVADIATGTGIWLKHVSELLTKEAPSDRSRYYQGFDISPAQFPANAGDIHFSVQDVLEPFPPEHMNRYDLVHVRFLAGAIRQADYKAVVANLVALLKPGGYIQWVDFELDALSQSKKDEYPRFSEIAKQILDFGVRLGLSSSTPAVVYEASKEAGLVDVTRHECSTLAQPQLHERAQRWMLRAFRAFVPQMLLRSGKVANEETALRETDELLKEIEGCFAAGVVPDARIGIVVGRKPE